MKFTILEDLLKEVAGKNYALKQINAEVKNSNEPDVLLLLLAIELCRIPEKEPLKRERLRRIFFDSYGSRVREIACEVFGFQPTERLRVLNPKAFVEQMAGMVDKKILAMENCPSLARTIARVCEIDYEVCSIENLLYMLLG